MNENGRLAAEYAKRLLAQEQDMVDQIRAFDRSRHTIGFDCCAPILHAEVASLLSQCYTGMTISFDLKSGVALLDPETDVTYYLVCKAGHHVRFSPAFRHYGG